MNRKVFLSIAAGLLLSAVAAFAHHSLGATYDANKTLTLDGKILQLLLRNPHSFLQVEAADDKGVMQRWSLEWRSSGSLGQQGIKRDSLKSGEEVVVTINPSRTPTDHRGALVTLHRKSDGFGWGTRPGEVVE
ncbi:MAG: DUF6152 family protein [Acidobacteriota bacterium]